jgi:TPR repeat protein
MVGEGGHTQFNVAGGGDPFGELLRQVQQAAQGVYDILGEMGRSKSGNVVYLAREVETGHLVALKLTRGGAGEEYSLEVVRTLDSMIPGLESKCPECKTVLPDWDRFCFHCGADLSAGPSAPTADEVGDLLAAVKEATAGEYEILGQMDRADGGGMVFFARDRARGKLVALRLRREQSADPAQASFSIGETQVLRPLAAELGQTQVLGASSLMPRPEPPPASPISSAPPTPPGPSAPARPRPRRRVDLLAAFQRVPRKVIWGAAGGIGVAVIALLALSGGEGPPPPPPPQPDTAVAGTGGAVDSAGSDSVIAVDPPPPPPPLPAAPDSATVRLVVAPPAGAVFTVDGAVVRGRALRVAAGPHRLQLVAPGSPPATAQVELTAGQTFRWAPQLRTVVAVQPASPPAPQPAPAPPPPPPATCARAFNRSDWPRAAELCLAAANSGDREAQRMMGRMRELGNGIQQDLPQAASWYLKAAAAGDAESQRRLGYLYRRGTGVGRDERESARWFLMAAEQGDAVGQVEYGLAVEEGDGVRKSEAEAADWYRKAAAAGNAMALRRLGRLYERGRGLQKNEAEAAHYYEQAGEKGDAEAMFLLGRMYKDGRGVERSPEQALRWFQKAAALGHRDAAEEARKLERSA